MDGVTSEAGATSDDVAAGAVVSPTIDFVGLLCLVLGVASTLVVLL
ncbi:MAG: hypothetical protein ABEH47_03860 [Haloferacaceae archaeon]